MSELLKKVLIDKEARGTSARKSAAAALGVRTYAQW